MVGCNARSKNSPDEKEAETYGFQTGTRGYLPGRRETTGMGCCTDQRDRTCWSCLGAGSPEKHGNLRVNDCEESEPGHSALVEMEGDKVQGWICAVQAQEQGGLVCVRYVPYKDGARLGCDGSVDDVGSPSAFTADPHSLSLGL